MTTARGVLLKLVYQRSSRAIQKGTKANECDVRFHDAMAAQAGTERNSPLEDAEVERIQSHAERSTRGQKRSAQKEGEWHEESKDMKIQENRI